MIKKRFFAFPALLVTLSLLPVSARLSGNDVAFGPVLGSAHAIDGDHGGLDFGLLLSSSAGHLDRFGSLHAVQEVGIPFLSRESNPPEEYADAELGLGWKLPIDRFVLSGGIGAGILYGIAHTGSGRVDTTCGLSFFSDKCSDPSIKVRYDSRKFVTVSANPNLRIDYQPGRRFGLGCMYKAIVNGTQGLGVFSVLVYYGNRL
jgi:hypothetical protein